MNAKGVLCFGSSTWARTRDLRINSPALYRLSYRGIFGLLAKNTQNQEVFKTKQLCYSTKPRIVAKKIVTIQGEQLFYAGLKNA